MSGMTLPVAPQARSVPTSRRRSGRVWPITRLTILVMAGLSVVVPLLLLISGSLMSQQELNSGGIILTQPQFSNFLTVWNSGDFGIYFLNSVIYVVIVVPISLLVSAMAAFGFARMTFPGRGAMFGAVLSILMFPIAALFIPVFAVLVSFNLVDTRVGYLLVVITSTVPLSTFILHRFFNAIPGEIEESARIDGANSWTTFFRICLPLVRPGLAAAGILTFVTVWNEFLMAVIILNNTDLMPVQQGLMQYSSADRPQQQLMLAAAVLTLIPMVVLYAIAQKGISRGIMEGAVRG